MGRWVLVACWVCACTAKPGGDGRASLRVPLPDGWKATAVTGGLQVGPPAHLVLQLESTSKELPSLESLLASVEREKVQILQKESTDSFVGVRYHLSDTDGFLGVRRTGPRTIWCSTVRGVTPDEVESSMTVCRSLSWDAAGDEH